MPIESDAGYWSGTISLGGATLPMSLYIDASVSDASFVAATELLGGLPMLLDRGRAAIANEATNDPTIRRDFFQFHVEEVPECLPEAVRDQATNEAFAAALKLVGVGLHSDADCVFQIWLDYSYGREFSDELLSVKFRPDGSIQQVSHES